MGALAAALAAVVALNAGLSRVWTPPPRAVPTDLPAETAVQDAGLLSLGMRRLAADVELLRLLVYYGNEEAGGPTEEHQRFEAEHPEWAWGGGVYLEFGPRVRRILRLDPGFTYVALFGSGSLAFNLNRPDEALDILQQALAADPRNPQLHAYAAAIGVKKKGDISRVLELIEPFLHEPDCPTMMKSVAAFLYKRTGRRAKAVALYREILETSRDAGYRGLARRALEQLGAR